MKFGEMALSPAPGPTKALRWTLLLTGLLHLSIAAVVSYKFDWHISGLIRINREWIDAHPDLAEPGLVVLTHSSGFDGKEHYRVAADPFAQHSAQDPYRLKRILYPLASSVLAFGRQAWLPLSMFVVNLLAILGGTFYLGKILMLYDRPPVWALLYGTSIGEIVGVKYSLTTPLALALAIAAVYYFARGRAAASWALFAVSLLANEYTLVIPLLLGACDCVLQRRWKPAIVMAATPVLWVAYLFYVVSRYNILAVAGAKAVLAEPFQGFLDIIRHLNPAPPWRHFVYFDVAPLMVAVLVVIIAASQIHRLRLGISPFPLLILYYLGFSILLKEDALRFINISRYLSAVFPLMVIGSMREPSRIERAVALMSIGMSVLAFIGILVEPRVPFVVWP